jgi:hypothetical protein
MFLNPTLVLMFKFGGKTKVYHSFSKVIFEESQWGIFKPSGHDAYSMLASALPKPD